MKYKTTPGVRLTDHTAGRLEISRTGVSVAATELDRDIVSFFQTASVWDTYPRAGQEPARAAFESLKAAGLIEPLNTGAQGFADRNPLARPAQTMFAAPHRQPGDIQQGEIVFLGAPFDGGTTGFPGARFGPQALRAASVERYQCELDIKTGRMIAWNVPALGGAILGGARLSDLGDVIYHPGQPVQDYYDTLRHLIAGIYAAGGFPVLLGGDHSVTYASVPETVQALIHLDAHSDLAETTEGHSHHHGNVMRRLLTEERVPEIHHFGLRDTSGWDTRNAGTFAQSVGDLELPGWSDGVVGKTSFVSLDLDVLDPTVLPGTGTPVVGGLTLRQLCQVLSQIARRTQPKGLDVVELCPMRDATGLSERTAIEAILCFLAVYHSSHGENAGTV